MKRSVSVAIRSAQGDGAERVLAVLRPARAHDPLGGLWGLPAATAFDGETPDEAAARVLRDKLGLHVPDASLRRITEGQRTDSAQPQSMTVYLLEWTGDTSLSAITLPSRPADVNEEMTFYEAWRWAAPEELSEAARRGSLCTRLYLDWLTSGGALDGRAAG